MFDSILCLSVKLLGFVLSRLPLRFSLWLGACLGSAAYYLRKKRRRIAYVNLKSAFGSQKTPRELVRITKKTFRNLGRNLIEVLLLPKIDQSYVDKYFRIEGIEEVDQALSRGRGAILLTAHLGNWELSSLVAAIRGYPLNVLARQQKFPRLNKLLISYREIKGCRVISKGMAVREIFKSLRNNQIVGILADQDAGEKGVLVNFFGREASTHQGAIKFALKENSVVLPAFTIRENGPYHRIVIKPPLELEKADSLESNVRSGLKEFTTYLEDFISSHPEQWLWQHKRWKSTPSRSIVILSDGKAGHLNQSKAVAKVIEKTWSPARRVTVKIIEVKFKHRFAQDLFTGCAGLACGNCQGCMRCLKFCLERESYQKLIAVYADIIISAGRSLCGVNLILTEENCAKSIVLMKPPLFLLHRFNLIIAPRHDQLKQRPNVVETQTAPNLIDAEYLAAQAEKLKLHRNLHPAGASIGALIGGDTLYFRLSKDLMEKVIAEILKVSARLNAELLLTTSRRTPEEIDRLLKFRLARFKLCKLLVIANQNNIEAAVGGILGLSQVIIVSGESVSMVSEAVSSGKYVVVFKPEPKIRRKLTKHKRFLDHLAEQGFISLVSPEELAETIERLWTKKPPLKTLDDHRTIGEAVKKRL